MWNNWLNQLNYLYHNTCVYGEHCSQDFVNQLKISERNKYLKWDD